MNRVPSQYGGALIVGLVILLILTVIGITGMQITVLDEKMAGNIRSRDLAFQAAESALSAGEAFLRGLPSLPEKSQFVCTGGWYLPNCFDPEGTGLTVWEWLDIQQVWGDAGWVVPYDEHLAQIDSSSARPGYILEALPIRNTLEANVDNPDTLLYRITARGVGNTPDAVVIVQSTFRK